MYETPLISVLFLCYNHENFVGEALNSVFGQNYSNLEVICGDDYSTDGTRAILSRFKMNFGEKITLIFQDSNKGITGNFNDCLKKCRGKYVFLMGGDDIFLPGKIMAQVEFMESNCSLAISYHDVEVFCTGNEEGNYLYGSKHRFFEGGADCLILNGSFCCGSSVAVRNVQLPQCDSRIKYSSDWLWYIEILSASTSSRIGLMPGVFAKYRRHEENITKKLNANPMQGYAEICQTLDIILDKYPEYATIVRRAWSERTFVYAIKSLLVGNYVSGIKLLFEGLSRDISSPWYFIRRRLGIGV